MKATDKFEEAIEQHLKYRGFSDPLFAEKLKNPNKSLKECVNYILTEVQKSKINGFEDEEIFKMAAHYYFEDDIIANTRPTATVIVNHSIKLTKEEIAKAKQEAYDQVVAKETERLTKKPVVTKPKEQTETKTLFG